MEAKSVKEALAHPSAPRRLRTTAMQIEGWAGNQWFNQESARKEFVNRKDFVKAVLIAWQASKISKAPTGSTKVPEDVHLLVNHQEADSLAKQRRLWYPDFEFIVGTDANGWYVLSKEKR